MGKLEGRTALITGASRPVVLHHSCAISISTEKYGIRRRPSIHS